MASLIDTGAVIPILESLFSHKYLKKRPNTNDGFLFTLLLDLYIW